MHLYIIPTVLTLLYFSFYLSFHFVSVLGHSLSSSSVVIHRLLDAKVVLPGNTANTSPLLTINFYGYTGIKKSSGRRSKKLLRLRIRMPEINL